MERRNVYCVVRHQGVYTRFQKRLWLVLVRGIKKGFREEVLFEAGSLRMRMWGEGCRIMTSGEDGGTSQIHRGFKHLSDKCMVCCLEYRRRIGRWCWERCQVPEPALKGPQPLPFSCLLSQVRGSALHPGHFLQCLLPVRLLCQQQPLPCMELLWTWMKNRESKSCDQSVTKSHDSKFIYCRVSLVPQVVKESACNVGDPGSTPGLGRPPREGNGNPLQYSYLKKSLYRGVWQATVHGVANSWTWLRNNATQTTILYGPLGSVSSPYNIVQYP